MTTQHLTEEQQYLLANWNDLSRKDRKVLNKLIEHLLSISLERRSRKQFMESKGFVDMARVN